MRWREVLSPGQGNVCCILNDSLRDQEFKKPPCTSFGDRSDQGAGRTLAVPPFPPVCGRANGARAVLREARSHERERAAVPPFQDPITYHNQDPRPRPHRGVRSTSEVAHGSGYDNAPHRPTEPLGQVGMLGYSGIFGLLAHIVHRPGWKHTARQTLSIQNVIRKAFVSEIGRSILK